MMADAQPFARSGTAVPRGDTGVAREGGSTFELNFAHGFLLQIYLFSPFRAISVPWGEEMEKEGSIYCIVWSRNFLEQENEGGRQI